MLRLLPCLLLLMCVPAAGAAGPVAQTSRSCSLTSAQRGGSHPSTLGATYVISLSESGTSCGKAKGVVKAFNACRHKHGKAGHCASKVKGYSCSERRVSGGGSFDSKTKCANGGRHVAFTYAQNT